MFFIVLTISFKFCLSSLHFSTSSQQTNHISKSSPPTGCITSFWRCLWQIISTQVDRQSVSACRLPSHYPRSRLKQALASFHCVREFRHPGKSKKKRRGRIVLYVHNCWCNPSNNRMLRRLYRDALRPLPVFLFSVFMETILTIWQSELELLCGLCCPPKACLLLPAAKLDLKETLKWKWIRMKRVETKKCANVYRGGLKLKWYREKSEAGEQSQQNNNREAWDGTIAGHMQRKDMISAITPTYRRTKRFYHPSASCSILQASGTD